ncbi:MAG: hypothetical protein NVSMB22_13030 [Chloroflexota bacterium]
MLRKVEIRMPNRAHGNALPRARTRDGALARLRDWPPVASLIMPSLKDIELCLRVAPLLVLSFFLYASLTSSAVMDNSFFSADYLVNPAYAPLWHPGYLNIFDLVLVSCIGITWLHNRFTLDRGTVVFLFLALLFIAVSLASETATDDVRPLRDAITYWLRFAAVFSVTLALIRRIGTRPLESVLNVTFFLLAVSALFVFRENFGKFNRLYAASMSVASFSQITVIVLLIALVRRNYALMLFAMGFLFMSFSLTSSALFIAIGTVYILVARSTFSTRERFAIMTIVVAVLSLGLYITSGIGDFGNVYQSVSHKLPGSGGEFTLNGRTTIWQYGVSLLTSGSIGPFGVGFGRSSYLFNTVWLFDIPYAGHQAVDQFHSILLEYGITLGIPALGLFALLIRRIVQTWRGRCYPAALIFTFLFLSQTLDFTIYRPKEVILWGLILGIAESQWRMHRDSAQKASPARFPAATLVAHTPTPTRS